MPVCTFFVSTTPHVEMFTLNCRTVCVTTFLDVLYLGRGDSETSPVSGPLCYSLPLLVTSPFHSACSFWSLKESVLAILFAPVRESWHSSPSHIGLTMTRKISK